MEPATPPSSYWKAGSTAPAVLGLCIIAIAATGPAVAFHGLEWWWSIAVVSCLFLALLFLLMTHVLDPGVLQPNPFRDPLIAVLEHRVAEFGETTFELNGEMYTRGRRGTWMRHAQDLWAVEKYCRTCNIWRPPRAHHCDVCGLCMRHFDHHCTLVGSCVAEANHRWFTLFLLSALAGDVLLAAGSVIALMRSGFPGKVQTWQSWITLSLTPVYFYTCIVLLFGVGHLTLMLLDITSKDIVLGQTLSTDRPCFPGHRSPQRLLSTWCVLWCGGCKLKRQVTPTKPASAPEECDSLLAPLRSANAE